jgi:acetolactate synthase-1/2/3 large subunit
MDSTSSSRRVVDYVVGALAEAGIGHVFGVGGANIEDLYDAANAHGGVTAVLAKHEFSAATMADGYSRAGAQFGVVAATSGGAALNLVPGLGESLASRIPVLALVGQAPSVHDGRGSFQDTSGVNGSLDAQALFAAVSVHCRRVCDPSDIGIALSEAVGAARTGGPAVLLLPKDVQQAAIGAARYPVDEFSTLAARSVDTKPILDELLAAPGRVTILAGDQIARDDARSEFEALRVALGARVATTPDAKDLRGALGVTGVMGHPGVAEAIVDDGICLLVGTRLPSTASAGLEKALARVRTISIGSATPYVPCTHFQVEDLRAALTSLTRDLADRTVADPHPNVDVIDLKPPRIHGQGIRYREAMSVIDDALADDTDILVDAGNTGAAAIHHLPARPEGRLVVALGMGGMGYSFGAGIGMAFARPHRRTVVIAGDGAFYMHGMEIHTAVQYRLPITFVLLNNNAHAMCVTREQLFYGGAYSYNRFTPSLLGAGLAAMFPGLFAVDVAEIANLPGVLREALVVDGPSVVSVECSADEIPPFVPFLDHSPSTKEEGFRVAART